MMKKILKFLFVFLNINLILLAGFDISRRFRETKIAAELAPKTGRFIKSLDIEIFIQEKGDKKNPAVLFVHGMGSWSEIWRETMDQVSEQGFYVISIDLPPFGFSTRPDIQTFNSRLQAKRILDLIKNLGLEKLTIVGHSFGGGPTLHSLLLSPEKFNSAVLVDIAANLEINSTEPNLPSIVKSFFLTKFLRNMIFSATATNPLLTKTLFKNFVYQKNSITDDLAKMIQLPSSRENTTEYLGDWIYNFISKRDNSLAEDILKLNEQSKMKKLIIWGDKDDVTVLTEGENLKNVLSNSELNVIPETGHIPQLENPKEFNQILINFLKDP
jgi:pimeloyl-ACP methyl ester carboxylesterase